jgi:hypothetical protein
MVRSEPVKNTWRFPIRKYDKWPESAHYKQKTPTCHAIAGNGAVVISSHKWSKRGSSGPDYLLTRERVSQVPTNSPQVNDLVGRLQGAFGGDVQDHDP